MNGGEKETPLRRRDAGTLLHSVCINSLYSAYAPPFSSFLFLFLFFPFLAFLSNSF